MFWSNAEERRHSEALPSSMGRSLQPYPIEWEDLTMDLRDLTAEDIERKIVWQDTLFNIHIDMMLFRDSQDLENHPKFLEIDWIQLTGAEELAQGELSPRDLAVELEPPGTLFAEPDFFPLGEGIGSPDSRRGYRQESQGAVGDVDGDGDADLVVAWNRLVDDESHLGWTVASNDGLGGFEPTQEFLLSTEPADDPPRMYLQGDDFDGDGLLDLVVPQGGTVEVWYNWGGGFEPTPQLSGVWPLGLADGDGDGDVDLLVRRYDGRFDDGSYYAILWINDGYDFVHSEEFALDSKRMFPYLPAVQPLGEAASLLWYHSPDFWFRSQGSWQLTRPWAAIEESPLAVEAADSS